MVPRETRHPGLGRHDARNRLGSRSVTTEANSIFKRARADLMRVKAKTKQKAATARKRMLMQALQLAQGLGPVRKGRRMSKKMRMLQMAKDFPSKRSSNRHCILSLCWALSSRKGKHTSPPAFTSTMKGQRRSGKKCRSWPKRRYIRKILYRQEGEGRLPRLYLHPNQGTAMLRERFPPGFPSPHASVLF